MGDNLIPISDEQAKLGQEALKVLQGFGSFLRDIVGTIPEDLVGVFCGDWLKVRRAQNLAEMLAKAKEELRKSGVDHPQQASLPIMLPLLEAAANEDRPLIQDMFAKLLSAAADPARSGLVRREFVDVVKQMDPLDAQILTRIGNSVRALDHELQNEIYDILKISPDELAISLDRLTTLGCLNTAAFKALTPLGRELLRVCGG